MQTKKHKLNVQSLNYSLLDRCLILFVSIVSILALILFRVFIDRMVESQFELVRMTMEQTSENQKQQFTTFVNEKIDVLKILATYPDIYEMDKERQKAFIEKRSEGLDMPLEIVMRKADEKMYENKVAKNMARE